MFKKKRIIKLGLVLVLSLAMSLGTFVGFGCGDNKISSHEGNTKIINISVWKSGFGSEYIQKIVSEFKKLHPEYTVNLDISSDESVFDSKIELGARYNVYDLFITSGVDESQYPNLEPLNSVLDSCAEQETVTVKSKYNSEDFLDQIKASDGNYYVLPFGSSWISIVYNADIIDGVTYQVPYTTNQLINLVDSLKSDPTLKGVYPFIHFQAEGYWPYFYNVWQLQYDGSDYYYNKFLMLEDASGNSPSQEVMLKKDGRYEVMKVAEKILNSNTVYPGSNSEQKFTNAQTRFLAKKAVMMVNGTWLQNEMGNTNVNIKMMKTPVISSIIEGRDLTTIEDDDELVALIKVIDEYTDVDSIPLVGENYDVSKRDLEIVFEARNMMSCISNDNTFAVPVYAVSKEGAKEFIKFYHSDIAMSIFADIVQMAQPYHYSNGSLSDTSKWTTWSKENYKFEETAIPVLSYGMVKNILFSNGLFPYANKPFIQLFSSNYNRPTLEQMWETVTTDIKSNWNQYLRNAGLQ